MNILNDDVHFKFTKDRPCSVGKHHAICEKTRRHLYCGRSYTISRSSLWELSILIWISFLFICLNLSLLLQRELTLRWPYQHHNSKRCNFVLFVTLRNCLLVLYWNWKNVYLSSSSSILSFTHIEFLFICMLLNKIDRISLKFLMVECL